jgi:chaperone BCS1
MVQKTLDNLFLGSHVQKRIDANISSFLRSKDLNLKLGIPRKRGLIFNGPPGTGKSASAYALSSHLKMKLYKIPTDIRGKSELVELISKIPGNSIILFDEMDKILDNVVHKRKEFKNNCIQNMQDLVKPNFGELLLSLLGILDGYNSLNSCIIIFTSNSIDRIEPTLIRPGRIDEIIEFSLITTEQLENILQFVFPEVSVEKVKNDVKKIVKHTLSPATILFNCVATCSDDYESCVTRICEMSKKEN